MNKYRKITEIIRTDKIYRLFVVRDSHCTKGITFKEIKRTYLKYQFRLAVVTTHHIVHYPFNPVINQTV